MSGPQVLLDGVGFGESPRWHDGRLWFSDWGAQEVVAVDETGNTEVIARVDFPAFPMCIDFAADGRLLIVAGRDGRLLRREPDGGLRATRISVVCPPAHGMTSSSIAAAMRMWGILGSTSPEASSHRARSQS